MKTVHMRRTSVGRIGHYIEGKTYTVPDEVAEALEHADACVVLDTGARVQRRKPAVDAPEVEAADAPEAEAAEVADAKAKPPRRRRSR